MRGLSLILLLLLTATLSAQPVEVRRAEAVLPPTPSSIPANALGGAIEVRRAEPLAVPVLPAEAVPQLGNQEIIRTVPRRTLTSPIMAVFEQANGFYAEKMFDLAIPKYLEFLQLRAAGAERQAALFRLGESYRSLNQRLRALGAYRYLLSQFNTGDFVGPAAYRLGEIEYSQQDFDEAAGSFRTAAYHVRDRKLRLASKFFEARSLDAAGRPLEALPVYREVAAEKEDNPYRERAMFDLAEADAAAGLTDSAFRRFQNLAETAGNPQVKIGAAVKGGLLAIDARNFEAARSLLESAAANQELAAWRNVALAGLVRLDYDAEEYAAAASRAKEILPQLSGEQRPPVILLAANAHRQLDQQVEALALYDLLALEFPESQAAEDAGFHRLVSLVAEQDERSLGQINEFLASSANLNQRNKASLLKAEWFFSRDRFAEAAELYDQTAMASGTEKYRPDTLYKLAWSRLEEKKYEEAIEALTSFVRQYPRHPQVASAYALRAMAQLQTGQQEGALRDFEAIIGRYSGLAEREDAMVQRALLLGKMQRPAEMAAAFERLLAEYSDTAAAAQANFWIGYAAFDDGKYDKAIKSLESARRLGAENYGERATLRILLSYYYGENRAAVAREAAALGSEKVPIEVRTWLGISALEDGDHTMAVQFLAPLVSDDDASDQLRSSLAQAHLGGGDYEAARDTLQKLLPRLHEPKAKARAHLLLAEALLNLQLGDEAKREAEEALRLQPEGRLNAEARLANGRALVAQNLDDAAARAFMALALLYQEEDLTPEALVLAEEAYLRADNPLDATLAREDRQRRYPDYKPAGQP